MSDAREEMRDAIRRGLRDADVMGDPDQVEYLVDGVMALLMETRDSHDGWFILGTLGHVYSVQACRMTNALDVDHSLWNIQTRNDL